MSSIKKKLIVDTLNKNKVESILLGCLVVLFFIFSVYALMSIRRRKLIENSEDCDKFVSTARALRDVSIISLLSTTVVSTFIIHTIWKKTKAE